MNRPISASAREALRIGESTAADVLAAFGPPTTRFEDRKDGVVFVQLIYLAAELNAFDGARHELFIVELKNDRMNGALYVTNEPENQYAFDVATRETNPNLADLPPPHGEFRCPGLNARCEPTDTLFVWSKLEGKDTVFAFFAADPTGRLRRVDEEPK